jgi:hypothetical protein
MLSAQLSRKPLHNASVERLAPLTCLKVKRAAFCD